MASRRTRQLTALIADIAVVLAGRAGEAVLSRLGVSVSRTTVLRLLMALPIPSEPVPAVLSVDDFALRRGHRYATLLIDAVTHRRVDVLPGCRAATLAAWLREHPGAEMVRRDGSAAECSDRRVAHPGCGRGQPIRRVVDGRRDGRGCRRLGQLHHGGGKAVEAGAVLRLRGRRTVDVLEREDRPVAVIEGFEEPGRGDLRRQSRGHQGFSPVCAGLQGPPLGVHCLDKDAAPVAQGQAGTRIRARSRQGSSGPG